MKTRLIALDKLDVNLEFKNLIKNEFEFNDIEINEAIKKIKQTLSAFNDDIKLFIESNYVDKVFRDSYYIYYATKLKKYKRNCIKISIFPPNITLEDICSNNDFQHIKDNYLGFLVLRPTSNNIIGRNVISPKILKEKELYICTSDFESSVYGLKCKIKGFPHSSQDGESIKCAETSIWALMEYFGNKYPEYKPILPSQIVNILKQRALLRQIPSNGLPIDDISYILKNQGFGTLYYSNQCYDPSDFKHFFSCYVDSGTPLVVALSNEKNIFHANLCIGYKKIDRFKIDNLKPLEMEDKKIFDYSRIIEDFVFIDDNMPSYQVASFETPTSHYCDKWNCDDDWKNCKIINFIVPFYHKNYQSATEAISLSNIVISKFLDTPDHIYVRTYLASTKTYKDYIRKNTEIDTNIKTFLLELDTSKFIWITEISKRESFINEKVNGLLIIDPTGNPDSLTNLICAFYDNNKIFYDKNSFEIKKEYIPLQTEFSCFNNLSH